MLVKDVINKLKKRNKKDIQKYIKLDERPIHKDVYLLGHVHTNDDMLWGKTPGHINHYVNVGISALKNIEDTLEIANKNFEDIKHCLDLPCGYGRVLRILSIKIPPKLITVCDINEEAVRYCNSEFGCEPLISNYDFRKINFNKKYDLVWVGSLFTHINSQSFSILLEVLFNVLEIGGILIFTTHGEYTIEAFEKKGIPITREDIDNIKKNLYYYVPIENSKNYGNSICLKGFVLNETNRLFGERIKLLRYKYRGWDNHHDVYSFQRIV